jgi:hypothetical protein
MYFSANLTKRILNHFKRPGLGLFGRSEIPDLGATADWRLSPVMRMVRATAAVGPVGQRQLWIDRHSPNIRIHKC